MASMVLATRGSSAGRKPTSGIIRSAEQARKGQPVKVLLAAGRLEATVDEAIP